MQKIVSLGWSIIMRESSFLQHGILNIDINGTIDEFYFYCNESEYGACMVFNFVKFKLN